jgi:glycerol transport system ATP-binding protein
MAYGPASGKVQIGVRPEFVRLASGGEGLPATIERVEDVGRHKIVRLSIADVGLSAILAEGEPVPSSTCGSFRSGKDQCLCR